MRVLLRSAEKALWLLLLLLILVTGALHWNALKGKIQATDPSSDFLCYYVGAWALRVDPAALYEQEGFHNLAAQLGVSPFCPYFRYPPGLAELLRPLSTYGPMPALRLWTAFQIALLLLLVVAGMLWLRSDPLRVRLLLPLLALTPPVAETLLLGQVNILLLLFLLPTMSVQTKRSVVGQMLRGLGIALAAHLKPVWGLLLLWEARHRRAVSLVAGLVLSALLWGIEIALLGPGILPAYLASLGPAHHLDNVLLTGLDGSLWGGAASLFGLYQVGEPAQLSSGVGVPSFQPVFGSVPWLSFALPAVSGFALLWASLVRSPEDERWDRGSLLGAIWVMTATPHSGGHALLILFPALLLLIRDWPNLTGAQRLLVWGALALLPLPLWFALDRALRPFALTALFLLAGRLCLWGVLRTLPAQEAAG